MRLRYCWSIGLLMGLCASPAVVLAQQTKPVTPRAGAEAPAPPVRPNARPRACEGRVPDNIEVVRDVIYATTSANDQPIELKMDTAFPKESNGKPIPVVVYIHGGGWSGGSRDAGFRPSVMLAMGGYFAATIDYRLSGQARYPAAVHDCKAAIRFIRAHAEELGIDPNRIGVWGHSAGGHLSTLLGTTGNSDVLDGKVGEIDAAKVSSAVQCVVDISGPMDLSNDKINGPVSQWLGGAASEVQAKAKEASPLTHIDAKDPPVLIIHGSEDNLVVKRHPDLLNEALKKAGVEVEYLTVEGAGHSVTDPRAYLRAAEFFDKHLGGFSARAMKRLADAVGGESAPDEKPKDEQK